MREASWGSWPEKNRAALYRHRDELARSGILDRALKKGDRAPEFALPTADGNTIRLADLLSTGPVVLTFYRGYW